MFTLEATSGDLQELFVSVGGDDTLDTSPEHILGVRARPAPGLPYRADEVWSDLFEHPTGEAAEPLRLEQLLFLYTQRD
jgi:hypothetical protein